jgi:chromosome segregation ATPase
MESHVVNLQDKIQKLIDQYTLDKQKLEELENKVAQLTEENSQLFAQIEASGSQNEMQENKYQTLQEEFNKLETRYNKLQKILAGFETLAEGAIKKIDSIIPLPEFGE